MPLGPSYHPSAGYVAPRWSSWHDTPSWSSLSSGFLVQELTATSYAILGLLCVRPWSAYELAQQMKRSLRFIWPRAVSGVYQEPKKLVAHGLATASGQRSGKRTRTVYSATPKGRRAFRQWLAQSSAPPQFESEALVRTMLAEHGTKEDLLASLRDLRDHADALRLYGARLSKDFLETGGPFPQRLHLIALGTRFIADYTTTLRDWAEWAAAEVATWEDVKPIAEVAEAVEIFRSIIGPDLAEEIMRVNGQSAAVNERPRGTDPAHSQTTRGPSHE